MESFDQSLKHLLQLKPADFIRFGLGDPTVEVIEALPSGLPSRGRDIDGSYLVARGGTRMVAHVEFHRRHEKLQDLAIDVAEAQIRLFRRERLVVLSQIWDLYGKRDQPLLKRCTMPFGPSVKGMCSRSVYIRVNLRALGWEQLLADGPAALWPLVALTRDGATEAAVRHAYDAIEARAGVGPSERADHLAVLWFIAEAEDVPTQVMKAYISEEQLMASTLYQSILKKGKAEGKAEGEARNKAETIIGILVRRMGSLDPAVRDRIRGISDMETLATWYEDALSVVDADGARRLANNIQNASS